jgi:CheY-like chemotaxis protein
VWLGERSAGGGQCEQRVPGVRVLVADDDETMRSLYSTVLREVAGVSSLVDASDGLEAVRIARSSRCQIAVLDFNMPRLDGVEAALRLRRERPSTRVVVHSADPGGLEKRAAGLGLAVFDKLDFERLVAWVERQAGVWRGLGSATVAAFAPRQDFSCSSCGYGVVSREPPERCPMCHRETTWHAAVAKAPQGGYSSFG